MLKSLLAWGFTLLLFFLTYTHTKAKGDNYQFKLNGKIDFKAIKDGNPRLGLYGAKLQLWFLNKEGEVLVPSTFYLYQNQMKTIVKENGSFSFDFSMYADLVGCTQLAIEIIPACEGGSINYDQEQYIVKTSYGKVSLIPTLNKARAVISDFNPAIQIHTHNYQIEVNNRFAYLIRALTMAREYAQYILEKIGDDKNLPPVPVAIEAPDEDWATGEYHSDNNMKDDYIHIRKTAIADGKILYHEYGHFFHYYLIRNTNNEQLNWQKTGETYKEGITEFFSMAARSYAAAKYGDDIVAAQFSDHEMNAFLAEPFSNASYSTKNENVPPFAGYLWSIYDGPTHPYIDKAYKGMDNDDVDGHKYKLDIRIFKTIQQIGVGDEITSNAFHIAFLDGLSSELANSIWKIRSFMMINKGDLAYPMRRVPAKSATVGIILNKKLPITVQLQTYDGYISTNQFLNDFKIYKKIKGEWKYFKTYEKLPTKKNATQLLLEDTFGNEQIDYKLTPFNNSGESIDPVEFSYKPMQVSLTGDKQVYADEEGTWTAKLDIGNEGTPAYTYRWYMQKEGSNEYKLLTYTKTSQTKLSASFKPQEGKNFNLKVEIEDSKGAKTISEPFPVKILVKQLQASIQGPKDLYVYTYGNFKVTIKGGVPPYNIVWASKIDNNFTNIFQGADYYTLAGKDFLVIAGVTDAKGTVVNQEFSVNVLPMEVAVDGDKIAYLHKDANWQPNIKGGQGPYKVVWGLKKPQDNLFWPVADKYYYTATLPEDGINYLRVWVQDKNGITAQSEDFKVTAIYQPPYILIEGPKHPEIGATVMYYAYIEAGKGPFTYEWTLEKNGKFIKNLPVDPDYENGTSIKATVTMSGDYMIKLKVKDLYNNQYAYSQLPIEIINGPKDIKDAPDKDDPIFLISPNPASSIAEITYELQTISQIEAKIYDSQGNLVLQPRDLSGNAGINTLRLDVSGWKADTYILKIAITSTSGIKYSTSRIVVK